MYYFNYCIYHQHCLDIKGRLVLGCWCHPQVVWKFIIFKMFAWEVKTKMLAHFFICPLQKNNSFGEMPKINMTTSFSNPNPIVM